MREEVGDADLQLLLSLLVQALLERCPGANIEDLIDLARAIRTRESSMLWSLSRGFNEPLASLESRQPELLRGLSRIIIEYVRTQLATRPSSPIPYLERLLTLAQRSAMPYIFTLNYDLLLESEADRLGIPYATGFINPIVGSPDGYTLSSGRQYWPVGYQRVYVQNDLTAFTADLKRSALRLLKLHGSLDWYRIESRPVFDGGIRLSPQDRVVRSEVVPREQCIGMMITGREAKVRLEEPYSVLHRAFEAALHETEMLVVIGYSFSDEHINDVITNAQVFERTRSIDLVVVNGPEWPHVRLSSEGERAWEIVEQAGRKAVNEGLDGLAVVPHGAEESILRGHLEKALTTAVDIRLHGL
jgi:hypothetical protein